MTSCNGDRTKLAVLHAASIGCAVETSCNAVAGVARFASSRDCATARCGRARRATGRGSSPGSRVCGANALGSQPCWLVCNGEPSSSAGGGGYMGRGEITSGNTYTCGGVPEPCVPSCRGDIIGLSGGASALDADLHRATRNPRSQRFNSAFHLALFVDVWTVGFCRKQSRR